MVRPASSRRARSVYACARALLVLLLLQCAGTRAQDLDDVSVGGTVADEHGAAVVGASVRLVLQATGSERTVLTDGEGRYRFVELPPGAYTARASAEGFADAERAGLEAGAGQSVRLDFRLRAAGVSAEQTVLSEADAPPVDTTRAVVGASVTREELERLPLPTRSPLDLVFTLGGVTEEPLSTLYSEILYVYETDAGVYGPEVFAHTKKLYVHVPLTIRRCGLQIPVNFIIDKA